MRKSLLYAYWGQLYSLVWKIIILRQIYNRRVESEILQLSTEISRYKIFDLIAQCFKFVLRIIEWLGMKLFLLTIELKNYNDCEIGRS